MIVYQSSKAGFLHAALKQDIEDIVLREFKARTGNSVAANEIRSWKESLVAMARVLNDDAIPPDVGVAIEYGIPQTSKRIDVLLTGKNADEGDQLLVVELKQWEAANKTNKDGIVRTRFSGGEAETSHPSYQAWSYASLLRSFNEAVYEGGIRVQPCAYLHNCATPGGLTDPHYEMYLERAPVFLKGESERIKLREFVRQHVRHGDTDGVLYRIENGRIRPSRALADSVVGLMQGKQEFVLIDEQKIAYESVLQISRESLVTGEKHVVIVHGGPGTGKSVVAINLLVALTKDRRLARYVSKNAAPRAVFEKVLTGSIRRTDFSSLFGGSGAFVDTRANTFDALIVDEAHRLNEKSGFYGNEGNHQVDEIISSSRCAVFFIDEDQRISWTDIGEGEDITRRARIAGAKVTHLELASQFRCGGSDGYLAWLDDTLGIRPTANTRLDPAEFDFRVFETATELRQMIETCNESSNKARMVAGYCWDWRSRRDVTAFDVVIEDEGFRMKWNLDEDGSLWIVAPRSVREIGCIHTCQGLEVEQIGVIVGPDLIVRDGHVVTRPEFRSKHDKSIRGYKKLAASDPEAARMKADRIIKNTYRTLMTRGMRGCYVFSEDPETREHFRSRLIAG